MIDRMTLDEDAYRKMVIGEDHVSKGLVLFQELDSDSGWSHLAGFVDDWLFVAPSYGAEDFDAFQQELRDMPYDEYLRTDHWQELRQNALERAGRRCQTCYSPDNLHVHHRTYENRGYEKIRDLTVLCADCHKLIHEHRKVG